MTRLHRGELHGREHLLRPIRIQYIVIAFLFSCAFVQWKLKDMAVKQARKSMDRSGCVAYDERRKSEMELGRPVRSRPISAKIKARALIIDSDDIQKEMMSQIGIAIRLEVSNSQYIPES